MLILLLDRKKVAGDNYFYKKLWEPLVKFGKICYNKNADSFLF